MPGTGLTRRGSLRAALGAAGAIAAGSVLAACGTSLATLTAAASRVITLTWQPWYRFPATDPNVTSSTLRALMYEAIQEWLTTQGGINVQVLPPASSSATIASMLAGNGPDVFWHLNLPLYLQQGLVLDLAPYVTRDRIDVGAFVPGQMDYLRAAGAPGAQGALYALPATLRTLALAVYEGALDALGLTYPEPGWTTTQWAALWASATVRGAAQPPQAGGRFDWAGYDGWGGNPSAFYLKGFGGEYVSAADPARSALTTAPSQDALQWCYGQILQGTCVGASPLSVVNQVVSGQVVSGPIGTAGDLYDAALAWNTLKWDLYAMPVFPQGSLTYASSDFYAVWAGTRVPDVAWALARYLCVGPDWQTKMIEMAMAGPNQPSLWGNWESLVRQYASPLAKKNLGVYLDAVQGGGLYVGLPFRYAEQQVSRVLGGFASAVLGGQLTVPAAAASAAAQIDALEATGSGQAAAAAQALQALQKQARAAGASSAAKG